MTGLILKDLLVMRKALKSYLMIMVLYAVLAYLDVLNYSFIITFIQVMLMVLPLSAFAYDEQAKWDRYAMSLPLGRVRVVGARYLFVLALSLGTAAAGLLGTLLLHLVQQADWMEMLVTLSFSTTIGLLIPAILLPLCYKLGAERARPYLYAVIFIPTILIVLLAKADLLDFRPERAGGPASRRPPGRSLPSAPGRGGAAVPLLPDLLPGGGGQGVLRCAPR